MPQYAYFDSTIAAPSPVLGWYDTDALEYPNLPAAANLLAISAAQWGERMTGRWAVSNGALVPYTPPAPSAAQLFAALQADASAALAESDRTVLRCYENSVAVPAAWATYRAALRAIVNGTNATATALPTRPAYPAGT